jgi:ABC-type uncharacterized transport system permease subunit
VFVTLTVLALLAYLAAAVLFFAGLSTERSRLGAAALWALGVGLFAQVLALVWGLGEAGTGPLYAMPGGLAPLSALLVGGYLALDRAYHVRPVGTLVAPLAAISLVVVLTGQTGVTVGAGGLDVLLKVHVTLAFIGTVAFALAFVMALAYTAQDHQLRNKHFGVLFRRLPALDRLDETSYRCILVGFPIYTTAILLGFVRAFQRDDSFTQANIVLALVTWLLYGLVLQARLTAGWRGRKAALMTVAGFLTAAGVVVFYVVR